MCINNVLYCILKDKPLYKRCSMYPVVWCDVVCGVVCCSVTLVAQPEEINLLTGLLMLFILEHLGKLIDWLSDKCYYRAWGELIYCATKRPALLLLSLHCLRAITFPQHNSHEPLSPFLVQVYGIWQPNSTIITTTTTTQKPPKPAQCLVSAHFHFTSFTFTTLP